MFQSSPILRVGAALLAFMVGLAALSYGFPYGVTIEESPLPIYIGLALVAGGLWACLPQQVRRGDQSLRPVLAILLIGLAMRGAMLFSTPVLEDDSYRYFWDGAVTARGLDPYQYAPAELSPDPVFGEILTEEATEDVEVLKALAAEHEEPFNRINYPYVSTIYPPLVQAAFAVAHWIDPFGMTGWRLVLLAADLLTFGLLLQLLRSFNRAPAWISLYWWNPVVILQGFGAGHMDLLLLPSLVGALLLARQKRTLYASLALVCGAVIKFWPVLLFPLLARPLLKRPVKLILVSAVFASATLLLLAPQLIHAVQPEAGLNAYASDWRTHAFLFALLEDVVFAAFDDSGRVARMAVAAILLGLTGYISLRFADRTERLPLLFIGVIAALIFLSPTGYPWYFIWLAPFLTLVPHSGLLALFVLAPLYWLRFQLGDLSPLYQWGIVPIAFGVPLALFAHTYLKRRPPDAIRHHYPRPE